MSDASTRLAKIEILGEAVRLFLFFFETHKSSLGLPTSLLALGERVRYDPGSDSVSYYWSNDRCLANDVNPLLRVYLSETTNQMVGLKISGVTEVQKEFEKLWACEKFGHWKYNEKQKKRKDS